MVLMNHIVSHCQVGKALNLRSLVSGFLPLPLLFLHTEHVAFRDHDKLNHRILETTVQVSVGHQNLARLHLHLFPALIRAPGPQAVLPQIAGKTAGSGSGSGEKNDTVSLPFPSG